MDEEYLIVLGIERKNDGENRRRDKRKNDGVLMDWVWLCEHCH